MDLCFLKFTLLITSGLIIYIPVLILNSNLGFSAIFFKALFSPQLLHKEFAQNFFTTSKKLKFFLQKNFLNYQILN